VKVCMASKHTAVLRQYAESQLIRRHDVALYVRVGLPRVLRVAIQRFPYVRMHFPNDAVLENDSATLEAKLPNAPQIR